MPIRISGIPDSDPLRRLVARLDADGDGEISLTEVEAAAARDDAAGDVFSADERFLLVALLRSLKGEGPLPDGVTAPAANDPSVAVDAIAARASSLQQGDVSADLARLNETQRAVVADVRAKSKERSAAARASLLELAKRSGFSEEDVDRVLAFIEKEAPVTVNFNPDKALRQVTQPRTGAANDHTYNVAVDRNAFLIDAFLVDDQYKNQFETGITSGSSSAYAGGSRDKWEETIFEKGYHGHPLLPQERPKYGALNAAGVPGGPAQSYGSCYFILKPGVKARTSFTPRNSSGVQAADVGTADAFQHVLAKAGDFKNIMDNGLGKPPAARSGWGYLEAQVHGPVDFAKDVAVVVVHTKFSDTAYEQKLRAWSAKHSVEVRWHDGTKVLSDEEWSKARPTPKPADPPAGGGP
jgi:Protein of unknown function (DUF3626)